MSEAVREVHVQVQQPRLPRSAVIDRPGRHAPAKRVEHRQRPWHVHRTGHQQPGLTGTGSDGLEGQQALLVRAAGRSEEHTSELQSRGQLVCRLLLEKKKNSSRAVSKVLIKALKPIADTFTNLNNKTK